MLREIVLVIFIIFYKRLLDILDSFYCLDGKQLNYITMLIHTVDIKINKHKMTVKY